ncbi:hypothetical protein A4G19_11735 [Pasteurellaceae bacterium Macca]|nr:hypothetical protein [Pasteurellaceae bacterium Macca]
MKKALILGTLLALTVSAVEAKRGGSFKMGSSKTSITKSQAQPKTHQQDATFANTPNQPLPNNTVNQGANGNRLNNFVTGAAAGYLLSNALAPSEAQAQTQTTSAEKPMEQLSQQVQQNVPTIPAFKAVDPQNDPHLIERTPGYLRYCLNGVQYLVGAGNTQLAPTLMVDKNNTPVQCVITQ